MAIDFYSVKLKRSVSMPEGKCTKKTIEFTTKKNKTAKRYMVCCQDGELNLSKFLKASEYASLTCQEEK